MIEPLLHYKVKEEGEEGDSSLGSWIIAYLRRRILHTCNNKGGEVKVKKGIVFLVS